MENSSVPTQIKSADGVYLNFSHQGYIEYLFPFLDFKTSVYRFWPNLILTPYLGTKMEVLAWTHATSFVTDQITLMLTLPENRHQYLELNIHERLSLADVIVLVQCLGLTKAAEFVSSIDPWLYPGVKTTEPGCPGPGCRTFIHSAVDKATFCW